MRFLFLLSLLLFLDVHAQEDLSVSDLNSYQDEVKQTILSFFNAFHKGDTVAIKEVIGENLVLQTIYSDKNGGRKVFKTPFQGFLNSIGAKPEGQHWNEKLLSFTINADSIIATAWTPYEFSVNDNFSHCGVNVFQLFNDGTNWRIIAIADTRKKEGCNKG
ncbi:nuclear transport factor 2 family protein [Aquimarina brevivitae]|uniref:Lumazine-binding protein n=1 Tax=Aquimarina brevivitae TaxID=323412 RepID=A0A4Q7NTS6_9FLAO|nr:nuclear transport factor 2 family protein [Aquimarina brevivitae]RZS90527.1 hypothetical protein EV197_3321 [Aquimarina brevivitae]